MDNLAPGDLIIFNRKPAIFLDKAFETGYCFLSVNGGQKVERYFAVRAHLRRTEDGDIGLTKGGFVTTGPRVADGEYREYEGRLRDYMNR